jgi:hypothetical protein
MSADLAPDTFYFFAMGLIEGKFKTNEHRTMNSPKENIRQETAAMLQRVFASL